MRADRLLLLVLLLAACGGKSEEELAQERQDAAAKAAYEALAKKSDELLGRALSHSADGEFAPAWEAWREAKDSLGETPRVAEVAEVIRASEKAARHDAEYRAALEALNRDTEAETEAARLRALEEALRVGREFLEAYPDTPNRAEVEAGIDYAETERKLREDYLAALEKGQAELGAGRPEAALAEVRKALSLLDREPARELERAALSSLTPPGMVFIAPGFFLAGKTRDRTFCPGLYLDETEVTNAEYAKFVAATGRESPDTWIGNDPPEGKEQHPVVHVTLDDALAFAAWAGKRLPTEIEWERAARGTDGRAYPWGEEWDPDKGNFAPGGSIPVGTKPFDRSPDGLMDMAGNVMELTTGIDDPTGATLGPVIKGGHWSDDFHPEYALTFSRWPVDRAHADVGTGFRCAKSLP